MPPPRGADALSRQLHQARSERAAHTSFWPWMLLGVGGAVVLAGIVKGVDESVACGAECPTRPLTGILLLGGLAVSTGGFLWLQISYRTQRRLDSRVHQLQWQLQGLQHARRLSAPPPTVTLLQARF